MKLPRKLLLIITLLLGSANIFIFLKRNNGFEYIKYSGISELYPSDPGSSFFNKWDKYNRKFSTEEISQGLLLLNRFAGIDTLSADRDKVVNIAVWLYKSFHRQLGTPADSLSGLAPLLQYKSLVSDTEKQLMCGQFQAMFGFFCTAAGLKNRYVEVVPLSAANSSGYHEVNEVWLAEVKKWVMVDVTRNFLLFRKDSLVLSAAGYLDYRIQNQPQPILITRFDSSSGLAETTQIENLSGDNYFNKNYSLRYYLNMRLSEVYTPVSKIKRYVFGDPWYEMYSPGSQHPDFLFRIRQLFLSGFLLCLLLGLLVIIKYRNRTK